MIYTVPNYKLRYCKIVKKNDHQIDGTNGNFEREFCAKFATYSEMCRSSKLHRVTKHSFLLLYTDFRRNTCNKNVVGTRTIDKD